MDEVWVRLPPGAPAEAIRPDQGPVSKTGRGLRPLWVRVPPLPLHAAMVQWHGRRALTPEAGVRLPVAVRRCQVVEREDVRLLPGRRGFDALPGSAHRPVADH